MRQYVWRLLGGYALRRHDLRILYLAVFLSFLGASISFPLRLLYAQAHHASPAQIGTMAATFLLAPLAAQLPMGWLVDHWGRVPVLMLGLISHTLVSLLFIVFNSPPELIVLRFAEGICVSAFAPSVSAYIADVTPEEHRSEAYGVLNATLSGGMLIGPLVGGIVGQGYGFVAAFALNVAVEALAIAIAWGRIHEPVAHQGHSAEHAGATPGFSWRDLVSIPLLGAYTVFFCGQAVMGMLSALWAIWLHDLGGSYTYIGLTFSVFALPQIFFGAMAGRMSDRLGRAPLLLFGGILTGLVYLVYGYVTDLTLILVLGIVEGVFVVGQQPAAQGLLADASPGWARGRAQGMAGAVGAVGGSLAAFVSLPLYHDARPLPFLLAGGVMIVGAIISAGGAVAWRRRTRAATAQSAAVSG